MSCSRSPQPGGIPHGSPTSSFRLARWFRLAPGVRVRRHLEGDELQVWGCRRVRRGVAVLRRWRLSRRLQYRSWWRRFVDGWRHVGDRWWRLQHRRWHGWLLGRWNGRQRRWRDRLSGQPGLHGQHRRAVSHRRDGLQRRHGQLHRWAGGGQRRRVWQQPRVPGRALRHLLRGHLVHHQPRPVQRGRHDVRRDGRL